MRTCVVVRYVPHYLAPTFEDIFIDHCIIEARVADIHDESQMMFTQRRQMIETRM